MDDMTGKGKSRGEPAYEPSMSIIGWLVFALLIWAAVLVPVLTLS